VSQLLISIFLYKWYILLRHADSVPLAKYWRSSRPATSHSVILTKSADSDVSRRFARTCLSIRRFYLRLRALSLRFCSVPFLNKFLSFFLSYPCCSFLRAGVRGRVARANRTRGHNSLRARPLGHSTVLCVNQWLGKGESLLQSNLLLYQL